MLKILWILFWVVMVVTGITLLGGYFSTDAYTSKCSDGLIDCLTRAHHLPFWAKMKAGMVCVYHNVVCVLKQIGV